MTQRFFPSYEAAQAHYNGIHQEIRAMVQTPINTDNAATVKARATELLPEALNWPDKKLGNLLRKVCLTIIMGCDLCPLLGEVLPARVCEALGEEV